jgi:glycosyltransferase involved in cell wall biosynthesis
MTNRKLLFVVGIDWFFVSHRLPIAIQAKKEGYDVHIAAGLSSATNTLRDLGFTVHPLSLKRGSINPFTELRLLLEIFWVFFKVKPDLLHLIAIKPVIYGGIAARTMGIKNVIAAVSGLGSAFIAKGFFGRCFLTLIRLLYRFALGSPQTRVIFQNEDDRQRVMAIAGLKEHQTILISGSGVDLTDFDKPEPPENPPIVMLAARLLRDKGVLEFVAAAKTIKPTHPNVRFCLVGDIDRENPTSLTEQELRDLTQQGDVEVWGYRSDMHSVLSQSTIVVLPSYREGFPKVLIEASASGRAIVTTDVPGCRDAVVENRTGLLVPARDDVALSQAILKLLNDTRLCKEMGDAGRKHAIEAFDVKDVVKQHLDIYSS